MWKNFPRWLKFGIIAGIFYIALNIIILVFGFVVGKIYFGRPSPLIISSLAGFLGLITNPHFVILWLFVYGDGGASPNIFILYLIGLIFYFLIGALIGLISDINKKQSKSAEEEVSH